MTVLLCMAFQCAELHIGIQSRTVMIAAIMIAAQEPHTRPCVVVLEVQCCHEHPQPESWCRVYQLPAVIARMQPAADVVSQGACLMVR